MTASSTKKDMTPVTIYEIAKRGGVSSSTVARVLRGDVKESYQRGADTASKIRMLASEMGYRANLRARAFSRGRTSGIGLLYTDDAWIFEGVNSQVVSSLVRSLQRSKCHLVFVPIDETGSWEDIVLGGQIDGGVVFQPLPAPVHQTVRDNRLPIVLLGDNSDPTVSQVVVDDVAGAYAATMHLIKLGHRRILFFVHEQVKQHCSIADRRQGYLAAMAEAELQPCECLRKPEEDAIDVVMRGEQRPTGVICYSTRESTLLVHALWQYGVTIPEDVSIIGFNDVFSTRYMTPPLTVVGFDAERIGELGAKIVLSEIESADEKSSEGTKPTVMTVKPKLIVRGSTAPATARHRIIPRAST
jgi:LacI family transcriptional regulator, galactose operon repressor